MMLKTPHKKQPEGLAVTQGLNTSLNQKSCQRCGGFMITDRCLDIASDTGEVGIPVRRCIQCGDLIDPTIVRNRRLPAGDRHDAHQRRNYPKQIFIEGLVEQDKRNQSPTTQTHEVSQ